MFRIPKVKDFLLSQSNKKSLVIIVSLSIVPMATAVLYQHAVLYRENSQRMAWVETQVSEGDSYLELESISFKNEFLRHVYFVDLNNSVSKYGFCRYYQIKDVKVNF